jgi:hypothetical protein
MPTGFELRTGASSCFPLRVKCPVHERPLLIFADLGREDERQMRLSGLRYAVPRQQRVVSGLRAAGCSQTGERCIIGRR